MPLVFYYDWPIRLLLRYVLRFSTILMFSGFLVSSVAVTVQKMCANSEPIY